MSSEPDKINSPATVPNGQPARLRWQTPHLRTLPVEETEIISKTASTMEDLTLAPS